MTATRRVDVSVIVVSCNARAYLEQCLCGVTRTRHEVIVVDNGSTDGSPELVRVRYPAVRLVPLKRNYGVAVANNEGMRRASGRYFLILNSDAWPIADAVDELVGYADRNPEAGAVGPLLLNPDGTLQRSVRGFPTLWRLATECFFLRKLGPRMRAFNAFYGSGFDHTTEQRVDWLKAAVLLLRREAVESIGGYDPDFFVFGDEVDLCRRLGQSGWSTRFWPEARFVHVGGASTLPQWPRMHRELIRGHLLYFAKHHGPHHAEAARRMLSVAMWLRSWVFTPDRAQVYRETARWVSAGTVSELLDRNPRRE